MNRTAILFAAVAIAWAVQLSAQAAETPSQTLVVHFDQPIVGIASESGQFNAQFRKWSLGHVMHAFGVAPVGTRVRTAVF